MAFSSGSATPLTVRSTESLTSFVITFLNQVKRLALRRLPYLRDLKVHRHPHPQRY